MRSIRLLTVCLGLTLGWTLACSGGTTSDKSEQPEPEPKPDPKPEPAPNADKCKQFFDVNMPLKGGVITDCSKSSVTIEHKGRDVKALRWDYADLYKGAGWSRGDPSKGNPTMVRSLDTLTFTNKDDKSVTISSNGDGGGGGGGGGKKPPRKRRP